MRRRLTSLITIQSSWGRLGSTLWHRWPRNVRGQSTPEAGGDADRRPPGRLMQRTPRSSAAEREWPASAAATLMTKALPGNALVISVVTLMTNRVV